MQCCTSVRQISFFTYHLYSIFYFSSSNIVNAKMNDVFIPANYPVVSLRVLLCNISSEIMSCLELENNVCNCLLTCTVRQTLLSCDLLVPMRQWYILSTNQSNTLVQVWCLYVFFYLFMYSQCFSWFTCKENSPILGMIQSITCISMFFRASRCVCKKCVAKTEIHWPISEGVTWSTLSHGPQSFQLLCWKLAIEE